MLCCLTHPIIDRIKTGVFDSGEVYIACATTASIALLARAVMLVNCNTCNLQPYWIWPLTTLVLSDPQLVAFALEKGKINLNDNRVMVIGITSLLINAVSLALLPSKVANFTTAAGITLAGSIALKTYLLNS